MIEHFHHGSQVALFLEFTRVHVDQLKKLVGIHQVEISCQGQVARRDGVALDKGVAEFNIIFSLCSIAQVAEQEFAKKRQVPLH